MGRPVIVVNTATALPPERSLDDVLGEMLPRLEPYLLQVRYGGGGAVWLLGWLMGVFWLADGQAGWRAGERVGLW